MSSAPSSKPVMANTPPKKTTPSGISAKP
jgi:hypothetical protein